jgi:hypothetical protein
VIERIISGGQTGADQGGLAAAKMLGLKTGGTCPKGWRTDVGRDYSLHLEYGLEEDDSSEYPPRTRKNVLDSDGTVVFGNVNSPGSRLTVSLCAELGKLWMVNPAAEDLLGFIRQHDIRVLNVAGNRERTNPGIFVRTRDFLVDTLVKV